MLALAKVFMAQLKNNDVKIHDNAEFMLGICLGLAHYQCFLLLLLQVACSGFCCDVHSTFIYTYMYIFIYIRMLHMCHVP